MSLQEIHHDGGGRSEPKELARLWKSNSATWKNAANIRRKSTKRPAALRHDWNHRAVPADSGDATLDNIEEVEKASRGVCGTIYGVASANIFFLPAAGN